MDDDLGISTEAFLRLGTYLYTTQQTIDETNYEEQEILKEEQIEDEQELLKETIIELKQKRDDIVYNRNKLLLENSELSKKILVFDYERKLSNAHKSMSTSAYNIICLETNNIKHLILEYMNKQTKINANIHSLNGNIDAIDENIAYFERKII